MTPTFTFRSTYYGGQIQNGFYVNNGFFRNTEEFSVDMRPPTLERVWGSSDSGTKWKHVIEPEIIYTYVNGVNDFAVSCASMKMKPSPIPTSSVRHHPAPLPPQERRHR